MPDHLPSHKFKPKTFATILIGLVFTLVVLETAGHICIKAKSLLGSHSTFEEYYNSLQKFSGPDKALHNLLYDTKSNPYFGYTSQSGNNYGIPTQYDFPLKKEANDFYIGLFGSSMAEKLINYRAIISQQLQERIPALRGKNIKIVNFAIGGYKQPQQFIVFSFFFEQLDMAIQIDGWNEITLIPGPEFPIEFPGDSPFPFSYDEELDRSTKKYFFIRTQLTNWSDVFRKNLLLKYSSTLFLATRTAEQYLNHQTERFMAVGHGKNSFPRSDSGKEEVAIWARYLKMQHILADSKKMPFFSFLQPSQYSSPGKKLTENELKCCYKPGKWPINKHMQLRIASKEVAKTLTRHFDLNDVIIGEEREMFIDDSCHLGEIGNKLVIQHMADFIAAHWGRSKGSFDAKTTK